MHMHLRSDVGTSGAKAWAQGQGRALGRWGRRGRRTGPGKGTVALARGPEASEGGVGKGGGAVRTGVGATGFRDWGGPEV